jgi:hypothetical protein
MHRSHQGFCGPVGREGAPLKSEGVFVHSWDGPMLEDEFPDLEMPKKIGIIDGTEGSQGREQCHTQG